MNKIQHLTWIFFSSSAGKLKFSIKYIIGNKHDIDKNVLLEHKRWFFGPAHFWIAPETIN